MEVIRLRWELLSPNTPVRRLRRVLRAARATSDYGPVLRQAESAAMDGGTSVESLLAPVPFVEVSDLQDRMYRGPEVIDHPLLPGVRAALVKPGKARYTALAGSMARLREAAELPVKDRPESEFAVLVLFRPGEPAPSSADRELLWKAFQVPVYSLLVGFDGTLLAHECEAHRGWHASRNAVFEELNGFVYVTSLADTSRPTMRLNTGIRGKLETLLCDCGRPGIRVQATRPSRQTLPGTSLPLTEIVDVY